MYNHDVSSNVFDLSMFDEYFLRNARRITLRARIARTTRRVMPPRFVRVFTFLLL